MRRNTLFRLKNIHSEYFFVNNNLPFRAGYDFNVNPTNDTGKEKK
jgi:hypothetical protein